MFQTYFPPTTTVVFLTESHSLEKHLEQMKLLPENPSSELVVGGWTIFSIELEYYALRVSSATSVSFVLQLMT
jgi:hypothetical protein